MKAYSIDLRERVLNAYSNKEGSLRKLTTRLKVSLSFIQRLLKRYKEEGTVAPKPSGGGNPQKIKGHNTKILKDIVENNSDNTLSELCDKL